MKERSINTCLHTAQTIKVLATHLLGVSTQVRTTFLWKKDGLMKVVHRQMYPGHLLVPLCLRKERNLNNHFYPLRDHVSLCARWKALMKCSIGI